MTTQPIIHSIHCRGYRGGSVGFDDSDCDCGATIATLTARLAAAEAERDENYRLWKEACRVKDVRHKAAKERRNSVCLDCKCMRECLTVAGKWVCPECIKQRLAAAETRNECAICELTPGAISTCFCEECVGELQQRLAAAEEAARILFDDLSQFTRTDWLLERWPWLADEANGGEP